MKFTEENYENVKILLENIDVRKDRIITTVDNGDIVVIPSRKYPLKDKKDINIFTSENTEKLNNNEIQKIYDSLDFKIGKCYNNMKLLSKALLDANITNFKVYVGWTMVSRNVYPVHHCFIVYDEKYLLDPNAQTNMLIFREYCERHPELQNDTNEMRLKMVKITREIEKLSFSKKSTFGKILDDNMLYIASECKAEEGEQIYIDLIQAYPNHPIYQRHRMNAHGLSLVQQMIKNSR
ncbi:MULTISPECIES: hypothetical protein [unclassified Clostridium]|uniref:hypothetical protein n=1 Tax=unclassified Clostridium TaxID=2614128 RepID=UPI00207ABFDC|nr:MULTISPECIES: hypothetical protein [unclassified Clostridium]